MYERIITHDDFDGVISATVCSYALSIDDIQFAGPRTVAEARITITESDVVCDLPYPLQCGMWFDHHEGNLEEVRYRGINPADINGRCEAKDSCARVVFEYFHGRRSLPTHFASMVEEADVIDSFDYCSVDDWRRETPGKIIDGTMRVHRLGADERRQYMRGLVSLLKNSSINRVATRPEVRERYAEFRNEEKAMLARIHRDITFLPEDVDQRLVILDLTPHNRQPTLIKNLASLIYPDAEAIVEVRNLFHRNTKTNDLSFSMSLSLNLRSAEHSKDVGDVMRTLNIGSGHRGAGAGVVKCSTKNEMLRNKKEILREILRIFQSM